MNPLHSVVECLNVVNEFRNGENGVAVLVEVSGLNISNTCIVLHDIVRCCGSSIILETIFSKKKPHPLLTTPVSYYKEKVP